MIQRDGYNVSLWQSAEDPYETDNKIDSSILYDVVIVGCGITGVTAALLLQNAGMKCLLVEAHNLC